MFSHNLDIDMDYERSRITLYLFTRYPLFFLLTPLFRREQKDHGEEKIMVIHNTLVKFYGMRVVQDAKNEQLPKDPTVQSRKEKINGQYYVRSSKMRGE